MSSGQSGIQFPIMTVNDIAALGKKLKEKREDLKEVTQTQISIDMDVSQSLIHKYERQPERLFRNSPDFVVRYLLAYNFSLKEAKEIAKKCFFEVYKDIILFVNE